MARHGMSSRADATSGSGSHGEPRSPVDLDSLTLDAIGAGALRGRPVTVLGLARSGVALARFLVDAGA